MYSKKTFSAALAIICLLLLTACTQKIAEKAIEAKSAGKASISSDGSIKFKDKTSTVSFGADTKLPRDFPKDVPVFSKLKLVSTASANDKSKAHVVTLLGDGNFMNEATKFYADKMSKNGWTEKVSSQFSQSDKASKSLVYEKDNRIATVIVFSPNSNKTQIMIQVAGKQ